MWEGRPSGSGQGTLAGYEDIEPSTATQRRNRLDKMTDHWIFKEEYPLSVFFARRYLLLITQRLGE